MSGKQIARRVWRILFGSIVLWVLLRSFLLDYYEIASGSMLPTLDPGDHVIVKKLTYRFPETRKHVKVIEVGNIKGGDVVVFSKPIWGFKEFDPGFYGPEYVKRCYGMPGDTIIINRPELNTGYQSRVKEKYSTHIFPQDTLFKWSLVKMGPLWVPKRGGTILLDSFNLKLYHTVLEFEGYLMPASIGEFMRRPINDRTFTFKNDYYFFLGDNFYESEDSRYWGFVPRANLLGQVLFRI